MVHASHDGETVCAAQDGIALVLTVLVVGDQDGTTPSHGRQGMLDGGQTYGCGRHTAASSSSRAGGDGVSVREARSHTLKP